MVFDLMVLYDVRPMLFQKDVVYSGFYALFSCICTVIFVRFLKSVEGGENVRKE